MRRLAVMIIALALASTGCPKNAKDQPTEEQRGKTTQSTADEPAEGGEVDTRTEEERMREEMVEQQIEARGVKDADVLNAMKTVPRHLFMPEEVRNRAYMDSPAPIGHGQTISQPFIVASMTELLDVDKGDKVLEIGTGSGYQAAVLAELGVELYSIEIVCDLADRARKALEAAEYDNVTVKCGDGYKGWPEHAPFDRIIVTAAPPEIPDALLEQLAVGGRMVVPVGELRQELKVLTKQEDGSIEERTEYPVRFVPMVHGKNDAGTN